MRGSARSSQGCPSGVRDWKLPGIHRATSTAFGTGAAWSSSHVNTLRVLVSCWVAKNALDPQFCATRKLLRSGDTNGVAVTWPSWMDCIGIRITAAPAEFPCGVNILVVTYREFAPTAK